MTIRKRLAWSNIAMLVIPILAAALLLLLGLGAALLLLRGNLMTLHDAVEQIEESVTLPRAIFGGGDLFILHTHGDSMIDIGIKHGDLVVIRKQNTAENGDIIVAMMNGETTLKRFYKRNGKVVLHPENKEMKDIIVKDCEIQGVLVSCIHIYN